MASLIVVTRRIHEDALSLLRHVAEVYVWPHDHPMPRDQLAKWIPRTDAVLSMLTDRIDEPLIHTGSQLKIVANLAVGYDNIDVPALSHHNIWVTNTPDVLTEATAELTWALLLALARGIVPAREALLEGRWHAWSPTGFLGTELVEKTLGIVGLGRIGRAVARHAPGFGMRVVALGNRSSVSNDPPRLPKDAFLSTCDVISLHVPLTSTTRGLVDQAWLQAMKPTAFLINTARGAIVDETALRLALDHGVIAGAALDVFSEEPVTGQHPLAAHPRVLATPHIGSATQETRRAMAIRAAENIVAALSGHTPRDVVNPCPSSQGGL
jgi:glyoxylate reductase